MGLDTDIYRVNRKKAEAAVCKSYDGENEYIDYWSITNDVKSVCYQRKHYYLQRVLEDVTWSIQCDYVQLTKLQAYHVLHVMQQNHKNQDTYDRKRRDRFVREFKAVLHNFDWERDMMVWNWS